MIVKDISLLVQKGCLLLDTTANSSRPAIAYFSAEYGRHRSLPFYVGGLGFLAGDHLRECSDLNVPLVAVGFMVPQGYLVALQTRQFFLEFSLSLKLCGHAGRSITRFFQALDELLNQRVVTPPNLFGGAFEPDFALVQHDDPMGEIKDIGDFMTDHHRAKAEFLENVLKLN